jgi:hypothetical protein
MVFNSERSSRTIRLLEGTVAIVSARVRAGLCILVVGLVRQPFAAHAAGSCPAGITLTVHPGVPGRAGMPLGVAPDIPRGPFRVTVPLYPGATSLTHTLGDLVPDYPLDPYLQMAVAEYRTSADRETVMHWYRSAFTGCGWRVTGWRTNSNVLETGTDFTARGNPNLTVEMSFGDTSSGGTYIAYAVEDVTYPARPARSYLRGPLTRVAIALQHSSPQPGQRPWVSHTAVVDRASITQFVGAINALDGYHTRPFVCTGGFTRTGPAWLTFLRPNGAVVHAFEEGPGECLGLAVNGVRWLIDRGRVWNLMLQDTRAAHGRG